MGTMLAYALVRYQFPGRRTLSAVVDLPLAIPTLVTGVMLVALYGPNSMIGGFLDDLGIQVIFTPIAIMLALLVVTLPLVVRSVQPVLQELDPAEEEAAATLGANAWTTFHRVVLPAIRPAIVGGTLLTFARCLGEFGSVVLVAGNVPNKTLTAPVFIFQLANQFRPVEAAAVATVLFALSFVLVLVTGRLCAARRSPDERLPPDRRARAHHRLRRHARKRRLVRAASSPCASCTSVSCCSCHWSASCGPRSSRASTRSSRRFQRPDVQHAFFLTAVITVITLVVTTFFGVITAWVLVRQRFPGKSLLNALVDLPFALSPVTVGLACAILFGLGGWLYEFFDARGIKILFAVPSMVLVTIFICIPFTIREVVPVLQEIGKDEEDAARTLGASILQTWRKVTMPNIRWGLAVRRRPHHRAVDRRDRCRADRERIDQRQDRDARPCSSSAPIEERQTSEAYIVALTLAAVSIVLLVTIEARAVASKEGRYAHEYADRGGAAHQAVRQVRGCQRCLVHGARWRDHRAARPVGFGQEHRPAHDRGAGDAE